MGVVGFCHSPFLSLYWYIVSVSSAYDTDPGWVRLEASSSAGCVASQSWSLTWTLPWLFPCPGRWIRVGVGNVRACRSDTDRVKQEGFVQRMKEEQVHELQLFLSLRLSNEPRTSRVSLLHSQPRLRRRVRGPLRSDPVRCQVCSLLRLRGSCSPLPLCPRRWGLQSSPLVLASRVHRRRCLLLGGREERPPPSQEV